MRSTMLEKKLNAQISLLISALIYENMQAELRKRYKFQA